jgi:hypothetical protein
MLKSIKLNVVKTFPGTEHLIEPVIKFIIGAANSQLLEYFVSSVITLSFRYEYLNVSIDDNKFNYMPSSDFHDFGIEIGMGFSTKLGR